MWGNDKGKGILRKNVVQKEAYLCQWQCNVIPMCKMKHLNCGQQGSPKWLLPSSSSVPTTTTENRVPTNSVPNHVTSLWYASQPGSCSAWGNITLSSCFAQQSTIKREVHTDHICLQTTLTGTLPQGTRGKYLVELPTSLLQWELWHPTYVNQSMRGLVKAPKGPLFTRCIMQVM